MGRKTVVRGLVRTCLATEPTHTPSEVSVPGKPRASAGGTRHGDMRHDEKVRQVDGVGRNATCVQKAQQQEQVKRSRPRSHDRSRLKSSGEFTGDICNTVSDNAGVIRNCSANGSAGARRRLAAAPSLRGLLAPEGAQQLPLALGRPKVVDQGIQEAVETPHAQEHQIGGVGAVGGLLGPRDSLVELQVVRQEQTVGGREAQHEHHQHGQRHHHRSRPPARASREAVRHPAQRPDDPGVGHGGDQQGHEEEGHAEGHEVQLVVPDQIVRMLHIVAGGDVQLFEVEGLVGEDEGHRAGEG
ncbi:hypothetical protein EYF80_032803 [Liparis tanakae]|uniref:Uncharacterized protein n=1 Tax=Liparis tanakae TaxID=230148 RepID=A0A4Z2GW60_9TELE|nr:hypothetical protein EYF80_032803 [Liparis tanakae]